jgi:hypothetical protein
LRAEVKGREDNINPQGLYKLMNCVITEIHWLAILSLNLQNGIRGRRSEEAEET